ncbi:MAG: hypothetical protein HY894_07885 [Deltaproteobacteria bacterium]|nr:hypothetical protein [Deltaproteobacteria bacterium]
MTITIKSYMERGYTPLACNGYGGVAWQGEYVGDLWMWNGQYARYKGGVRHIQTVKVTDLKTAALRYWRDGWAPLRPFSKETLGRMEEALRNHRGLAAEGVKFPDHGFLKASEPIPEELFGPEVRALLGLPADGQGPLEREDAPTERGLAVFRGVRP